MNLNSDNCEKDNSVSLSKSLNQIRLEIYEIIEPGRGSEGTGKTYDIFMTVCIFISIVPLMFTDDINIFGIPGFNFVKVEIITTAIFIVDYILRFATEDFRQNDRSLLTFLKYPITMYAIIDLLSIMPTIGHYLLSVHDIHLPLVAGIDMLGNLTNNNALVGNNSVLRLLRVIRIAKILKVLKLLHYFKSVRLLKAALKYSHHTLRLVLILALGYIFTVALIMFNLEGPAKPLSFNLDQSNQEIYDDSSQDEKPSIEDFGDAVYFAAVSLTTVGYGDVVPKTDFGRAITVCSSLVGVAIIALPGGIITAGYIKAVEDEENRAHEPESNKTDDSQNNKTVDLQKTMELLKQRDKKRKSLDNYQF